MTNLTDRQKARLFDALHEDGVDLKKFKLVKNRQRPDFCYAYELKTDERKYSIFTMNGGKTFLASVEEPRLDGRWYSEFSETHNTIEECLEALRRFLTLKNLTNQ